MTPLVLCLVLISTLTFGAAIPGYHFSEGRSHTTLPFKLYKNLIVIPARLNDSLSLNLILDTGTRSIILYGKRFKALTNIITDKKLQLSGWGSSGMIDVKRSYPNTITIADVTGEGLCAAVVDNRKLFSDYKNIDGIIGYEIFARFAVEIDYRKKVIHLYDKIHLRNTSDFTVLPLSVNRARPEIQSVITLNHTKVNLNLLVDTGSSLGLAIFSKHIEHIATGAEKEIGVGLAGSVYGYDVTVDAATFGTFKLSNVASHLVHVKSHPDAEFMIAGSLGADFLKNYTIIFNYPTNQLFLKRSMPGRG